MGKYCVKLFFAGDFCSKPSTSLITVSDELKELIQSCDIGVVNFEVPLRPEIELPQIGYERFFQNDDAPAFLKKIGFNLFSMANNHMFDWGEDGFRKTKAAFGDSAFGSGNYDEAYQVKIVEINGLKIGFMALTYAADYGVFDDVMCLEGLGCAYIHDLRVNHDIVEAKKKVDFLFVLPHDGIEYIDVPLPEIIARYRDFIDWGADAVIGSHPHCPQGWEMYKGKPIFHSLGNFFFNSKEDPSYKAWNRPHWYEGLCVVIGINENSLTYEIVNVKNIDNISIVVDHDEHREKHNNQINLLLHNKELYEDYLNKCLVELAEKQEERVVVNNILMWRKTKIIIKAFLSKIRYFVAGNSSSDVGFKMLLKNDTRKNGYVRYLNRNNY